MITWRVVIALSVLSFLAAGRGVWSSTDTAALEAAATIEWGLPLDATDTAGTATQSEYGRPRTDIYGNDIEQAVTDYLIDGTGGLYERHAPDTEVPTLTSPIL